MRASYAERKGGRRHACGGETIGEGEKEIEEEGRTSKKQSC